MDWHVVRAEVEERFANLCLPLPEVAEAPVMNGRGWRVRKNHFCQIHTVDNEVVRGWTQAHLRFPDGAEAGVMIFRSQPPELDALAQIGHPFFRPGWGARVIGMVLEDPLDWDEVTELVLDSYCIQAPKKLAARARALG